MTAREVATTYANRTFASEAEAIDALTSTIEDYARQHANVLAEKHTRVHAELDETRRALELARRSP